MIDTRTDHRTYVSQRLITPHELTHRPQPPSRIFLESEAQLIAELARLVTMDGRRWDKWPALTLAPDNFGRGELLLRAEVEA